MLTNVEGNRKMDIKRGEATTPGRIHDLNNSVTTQHKDTPFSDKSALNIVYEKMQAENARRYPHNPSPLTPRRFNLRKTNDLNAGYKRQLIEVD